MLIFEDGLKKFRASENGAGFSPFVRVRSRRLIGGNESAGRKRAEPENIYNVVYIYKVDAISLQPRRHRHRAWVVFDG